MHGGREQVHASNQSSQKLGQQSVCSSDVSLRLAKDESLVLTSVDCTQMPYIKQSECWIK